jgi:hypothetical protein
MTEVLIAVTFVCFLLGFMAVLCIGNYYRARRAMERQRQRRLAQLATSHGGTGGVIGAESPKSILSGATNSSSGQSDEQRQLLGSAYSGGAGRGGGGGIYNPGEPRRRNVEEGGGGDLLLDLNDAGRANVRAI